MGNQCAHLFTIAHVGFPISVMIIGENYKHIQAK